MSSSSETKLVLFDLGGVLVPFVGLDHLHRWMGPELPREEVKTRWLRTEAARAFDRGQIDTARFAEELVRELELPLTPDELIADLPSWIGEPEPGAFELLDALEGRVARGCLSNTNEAHWRQMTGWGLSDRFEWPFLSHEMGRVKPDPEVFEHVVERTGHAAEEILFLDDSRINVEGARAVGLRAEQVASTAECRRHLATWLD